MAVFDQMCSFATMFPNIFPIRAAVAGLQLRDVVKGVWRFQDLVAWQLAVQLRRLADEYCQKPAIQRDFRFRDQLSDAACSAPRNIAEGFGRKSHRDFAKFAIIARASEQEVLNHFIAAHEKGYLDAIEFDRGDHAARKAVRVLNGLIAYLESTPDWGRQ